VRLRDRIFQAVFARLFVYNILFEDSEVDERFFELESDSSVLCISGAGCGVAGMLSRNPRTIDAVDINPHHLALAALKVEGARGRLPYRTFRALLGEGRVDDPRGCLTQLTAELPPWMQRHWRRHAGRFRHNLYEQGLTSRMVRLLRGQTGIDADWLRSLIGQPIDARRKTIDETIGPALRSPLARAITRSPLQLLALGVNYQQCERLQDEFGTSLAEFFLEHVKRLAETDLATNWFAWYFVTGGFAPEGSEGLPPYLRADRFARSREAETRVRFHRGSLFDRLAVAGPSTWSHYSLLDAPDWLDRDSERRLLQEIRRTGREGAIVLHRSVEDGCLFDRHHEGRHFERLSPESSLASALDRTRQYRHVWLHRLASR